MPATWSFSRSRESNSSAPELPLWSLKYPPAIAKTELHSLFRRFRGGSEDFPDGRFKGLAYETVSAYPLGYPKWAAYQSCDPVFRVYKRFGTLRNRLLLHRQYELAKLEHDLNVLDEKDASEHNHRIRSIRRDVEDDESKRSLLMNTIDGKLKNYDELLEREMRLSNMETPTGRQFRSLVNFLWNRKPVVRSETAFLKNRDDFILLNEKPESRLEIILETIIYYIPFPYFRHLFTSEAQEEKFDGRDRHTTLLCKRKIKTVARTLASVLVILIIGVPLYAMASVDISYKTKIVVLLVSLAVLPFAILLVARPKNHELFTAIAAYCAVLSTFLATANNLGSG